MSDLIILAPLVAIRRRTRLAKMVPVLQARGYRIRFFGWERTAGERKLWQSPELDERIILRGGGYASGRARLMYPLWGMVVFFSVLRFGRRAKVFCLGWETAFPALLASYFTDAQILFDDADRFSLTFRLPPPFQRVIQSLERWTSRRVALHVVPSFSRYEWRGDSMMVLRNAPSGADYAAALRRPDNRSVVPLVVYANGWVGETRGAPVFLEAMRQLAYRGAKVRMIVAGRVDGPSGRQLIGHPLVDYRGELSQTEALSTYREADLALTFYDPRVPINRLAESNKWGDCVILGVPFIVNDEVETAHRFLKAGAAFSVAYSDVDALVELLISLAEDRSEIDKRKTKLNKFRGEFGAFDLSLNEIINIFEVGR